MPRKPTNVPKDSQEELQPLRAPFAQTFNPNAVFPGMSSRGNTVNTPGYGRASNTGETRGNLVPANSPSQHAPQQLNSSLHPTSAGTPSQQVGGYDTRATQDAPRNQGGQTHPAAGTNIGDSGFQLPLTRPPRRHQSEGAGAQSQPASGDGTRSVSEYSAASRATRPSRQHPSARPGAQRQPTSGFDTGSSSDYSDSTPAAGPSEGPASMKPGPQRQPIIVTDVTPVRECSAIIQDIIPSRQRFLTRPGASSQQVGRQRATSTTEVPSGRSARERLVPFTEVRANLENSAYSSAISLPHDDNEMPREKPEGGYRHVGVSPVRHGSQG